MIEGGSAAALRLRRNGAALNDTTAENEKGSVASLRSQRNGAGP